MPSNPYVREAVKLILDFHNIVEQSLGVKDLSEINADSLATRLSNFPAIAMDSGVVPAITFYLSKIDSNTKRKLLDDLVTSLANCGNENQRRSIENLQDDLNGEAYVTASALLLSLMIRLRMISCPREGGLKEIAAQLLELLNSGVKGEEGFMEAAIELKKLGTAFYKKKKR